MWIDGSHCFHIIRKGIVFREPWRSFFARHAGLPVQFTCGVMKFNQQLEGHAWLVLDGLEFLEPSSYWQSFTVTVIFPQSAASSNHQ